jgi:hypothetical protein
MAFDIRRQEPILLFLFVVLGEGIHPVAPVSIYSTNQVVKTKPEASQKQIAVVVRKRHCRLS